MEVGKGEKAPLLKDQVRGRAGRGKGGNIQLSPASFKGTGGGGAGSERSLVRVLEIGGQKGYISKTQSFPNPYLTRANK